MYHVKQDQSLANPKVRISTQKQCMYEGPYSEEIYGISTQGITLTWKLHPVAKDEGIAISNA